MKREPDVISEPKRIAVVGASRNRKKFGNKCVRAYHQAGWTVYPINPATSEVEGLPAFRALDAVPEKVDRISLYTPPDRTRQLLPQLPPEAEIFFNPGTADEALMAQARQLGLRVRNACAIVAIGLSPAHFGSQDAE